MNTSSFCPRFIGLLALGSLALVNLHADVNDLNIDVRSVIEKPAKNPPPLSSGAVSYEIYSIREVKTEEKLVRPVSQATLSGMQGTLERELGYAGFHPVQPEQRPDVLITVEYGRGYLTNPYLDNPQTFNDEVLNTSTILQPRIRSQEFGVAAATEEAGYEKLFIIVTAWTPVEKKSHKKSQRLWTTTITIDDPDHRDLNDVYRQMLVVGAGYFNRKTDKELARVTLPAVPDGHVEVGDPKEITSKAPAK